MKTLEDNIYKQNGVLHHAYLIEGSLNAVENLIRLTELNLGIKTRGNPDVHIRKYESFGIDDGRSIQGLESKLPVTGEKKIFIVFCNTMTREAQNSLLKTFEEPTKGTHFFVIMPSIDGILETLKSRMHIITTVGVEEVDTTFAVEFLESKTSARMKMLEKIIEAKDKPHAIEFLNNLEKTLYDRQNIEKLTNEDIIVFEDIRKNRSYMRDRSASVKILLEHIALTLPVTS